VAAIRISCRILVEKLKGIEHGGGGLGIREENVTETGLK
jgi:hypothetical protein